MDAGTPTPRSRRGPAGQRRLPWIAFLAGVAVASAAWLLRGSLLVLESQAVDLLQELAGPRRPPANIAIVAIDDLSLSQAANAHLTGDPLLARLDRWPWPRQVYATLLERLRRAGVRAVAIDLLFDTPSSHGSADDAALAEALRSFGRPVVLGATVLEPRSAMGLAGYSLARPLPQLSDAAPSVREGLLNAPVDPDGAIRRPPFLYGDLLRATTDLVPPDSVGVELTRSLSGNSSARQVPLPRSGAWIPLLRFYGPPSTFPTLPIWSLLEPGAYRQLLAEGTLRDAVVLVGPTAATFQDIHVTPFSGSEGMPGVEIHATELANLLQARWLRLPRPSPAWAVLLGLWTWCLLWVLHLRQRPLVRFGIALAVAGVLVVGYGVAAETVMLLPMPLTLVGVTLMGGLLSTGQAAARNEIDRRRLRTTLGKYLSPTVVEELTRDPDTWQVQLGGRACEVVVAMIDIRGFTTKTTRYTESGRVGELVDQLNEYFSVVVAELMAEGATVDKFIGDAVLAYFGAPLSRGAEEDARAAVRAAGRVVSALAMLNHRWQERGLEPWEVVIVLSAGAVIVGNIGSPQRLDYTIIGDAVNRASRLEAVAKQTGHPYVCTEPVVRRAGIEAEAMALGRFPIRGQGEQPVFGLPLERANTESATNPGPSPESGLPSGNRK
jgi:adenylate cyclase